MIRELLHHMNVFVDGKGYFGMATEVEVPKPELGTREYSAGGMSAPIDVRQARHAKLTATITLNGFDPDLYGLFDITEGRDVPFTIKGSTEDRDGTTHAHAIKMRGIITKIDEGNWKGGEEVPLKLELSLRYYRRARDGVDLVEADPENMLFKLRGKDLLAGHRRNIGL